MAARLIRAIYNYLKGWRADCRRVTQKVYPDSVDVLRRLGYRLRPLRELITHSPTTKGDIVPHGIRFFPAQHLPAFLSRDSAARVASYRGVG